MESSNIERKTQLDKIEQINNTNFESYQRKNEELKHKNELEELQKVTKINSKLTKKKDKLLSQREAYRKKVKSSNNQIITSTHESEKIEELRLQIASRLKLIDKDNERVKEFNKEYALIKVNRDDFSIPEFISQDKNNRYLPIDETQLTKINKSNEQLIAKIKEVNLSYPILEEVRDFSLNFIEKINQIYIEKETQIASKVNTIISNVNLLTEELSSKINSLSDLTNATEKYKSIPSLAKELYKKDIETLKNQLFKLCQINEEAKKQVQVSVNKAYEEYKEERNKFTPKVNLTLTELSGNTSTLLEETDKYTTVKRLYNELYERRERLHQIEVIEKHLEDTDSKLVITKDVLNQYKKFKAKYTKLNRQKDFLQRKIDILNRLNTLFIEKEKTFTTNVDSLKAEVIKLNEQIYEKEVESAKSLMVVQTKKNEESVDLSTYEIKYKEEKDKLDSQISGLSRELISQFVLDREVNSILEATSLITKLTPEVKPLLKVLSLRQQLFTYHDTLLDTKDLLLAEYERKKVQIEAQEEIDKFINNINIEAKLTKLRTQYDKKDKKHLADEEKIRAKIAYYKENPDKDLKGKKIEKQYNKLTKVQHYTNAHRDELVVKLNYVELSRDNINIEIEHTRQEQDAKLANEKLKIDFIREGGETYAKKMMSLLGTRNSYTTSIEKIYNSYSYTRDSKQAEINDYLNYINNKFANLDKNIVLLKDSFNNTRKLQGSAVITRKFSKKRTIARRCRRAFVFISIFFALGLIEFIVPSWWIGLIIGVALTILVELLQFYLSSKNFVRFDEDKNIIAYDMKGDEVYFFKHSEIINYEVLVFPAKIGNIYNSKVVLKVETGSDIYEFTYYDPVNKELVINSFIDKIISKEELPLPEVSEEPSKA